MIAYNAGFFTFQQRKIKSGPFSAALKHAGINEFRYAPFYILGAKQIHEKDQKKTGNIQIFLHNDARFIIVLIFTAKIEPLL